MIPRFSIRSSISIGRTYRSGRPNLAFRIWWKSRGPKRDDARRVRAAGAPHDVARARARRRSRPSIVSSAGPVVAARSRASSSSASSTSERSKSMCGETGVSSRHREPRRHDRAARRERVRGRSGRRRDDHAVGGVAREERAVDRDVEADEPPRMRLLEHRLVERRPPPARGPVDSTGDLQHHPLARPRSRRRRAARAPSSRSSGLDLGEVAELADVHAEHRDAGVVDEIDGAQHRAVATERDRQIEAGGELLDRHRDAAPARSRPTRGCAPRRRAARTRLDHLRGQRRVPPARSRCGTSPTVFSTVRHRPRAPRATAASRSRRALIVGVALAGVARGTRRCRRRRAAATASRAITPMPASASPSTTSSSTARCTSGSRTIPPRLTRGPAGLELRLHQQHELRRRES